MQQYLEGKSIEEIIGEKILESDDIRYYVNYK